VASSRGPPTAAALPQVGLVILASRRHHQPAHAIRTTQRCIKAYCKVAALVHCLCEPEASNCLECVLPNSAIMYSSHHE
jgi:hypothetical protein